jgi:hypothetical protein
MNTPANGPALLQENVGVLKSRMGTFFPGSHVIYRGHDLHKDLKDMDWVELWVFGITGRRFTREQLRLLHAIWVYSSYPDVRLWNNRVAGLAGSSRSTGTLGLAAALAVSEASIYGQGSAMRAMDFLIRTRRQLDEGGDLETCIKQELELYRSVSGYGRPLVNADERIAPLLALAKSLGLDQGPYLSLALDVEKKLLEGRWRMKMNYASLITALGADIGLTSHEFYMYMFPLFLSGMPPCFIEASGKREGTLYPITCADILYDGHSKRVWQKQA